MNGKGRVYSVRADSGRISPTASTGKIDFEEPHLTTKFPYWLRSQAIATADKTKEATDETGAATEVAAEIVATCVDESTSAVKEPEEVMATIIVKKLATVKQKFTEKAAAQDLMLAMLMNKMENLSKYLMVAAPKVEEKSEPNLENEEKNN